MIYLLKQRFGKSATLYRRDTMTPDYIKGTLATTNTTAKIRKVIKLGQSVSLRDIVKNASAKPTDALYQKFDKFAVDVNDLPYGWTIGPHDWLVMGNDRFDIENTDLFEDIIILYATKVNGVANRVISVNVVTYISPAAGVSQ